MKETVHVGDEVEEPGFELVVDDDALDRVVYGLFGLGVHEQVGDGVHQGDVVKGVGVFQTLKDIENLIVAYEDEDETTTGSTMTSAVRVQIFLKDVAAVSFRNREPDSIVRTNRKRCIGLSIYKETRYNTVKAVSELEKAFSNMKNALI